MSKNPRLIDLRGKRFGKWTVRTQAGNSPKGAALWECICECGTVRTVIGSDLRNGKSASCGCVKIEIVGSLNRTHGGSKSHLHHAWKNMRARCTNPNNHGYKYYGARGILICPEWSSYESFRDWALNNGYRAGLTLERVDVNGGYGPENCSWIPKEDQSKNRTINLRRPDGGLWLHLARENGIKDRVFRVRVFSGWPPEEAASVPMNTRRKPRQRGLLGRFV